MKALGVACAVALVLAPVDASARPMVPDDIFRIVSVGDVAFSPDGSKIVAVERRVNVAKPPRRHDRAD